MFNIDGLPPEERQRLVALRDELNPAPVSFFAPVNVKLVNMCIGRIDSAIGREGRIVFLNWLFRKIPEIDSSRELTLSELRHLLAWADPDKPAGSDEWSYGSQFTEDLKLIAKALGQVNVRFTTVCKMCVKGKVNRLKRLPGGGAQETGKAVCACCNGDWRHCELCASLGR